jgi:hypothetical protein
MFGRIFFNVFGDQHLIWFKVIQMGAKFIQEEFMKANFICQLLCATVPDIWMCVGHFSSLWQNTWPKQLKGKKFYFCSQIQRFQSIDTWPHCFWVMMRQNMVAQGVAEKSCLPDDRQEAERERERKGQRCTLLGHTPSDLLPPTRLYLLVPTTSQ